MHKVKLYLNTDNDLLEENKVFIPILLSIIPNIGDIVFITDDQYYTFIDLLKQNDLDPNEYDPESMTKVGFRLFDLQDKDCDIKIELRKP